MSNETDPSAVAAADARYTFDVTKLEELRKSSPWKDDARYFKGVAIGPSAVMKMVSRLFSNFVSRMTTLSSFPRTSK